MASTLGCAGRDGWTNVVHWVCEQGEAFWGSSRRLIGSMLGSREERESRIWPERMSKRYFVAKWKHYSMNTLDLVVD